MRHTSSLPETYDVAIIGGGIVGLATSRELLNRFSKLRMIVLEKEATLASHQSGHNSGVIHTGIYYAPGSLKAKLCVEGMALAYDYLETHKIPYKKCGKLIVAVDEKELPALDDLMKRATINQVPGVTMISGNEITSIEPHCKGLRAIYSPETGIVDWRQVALSYGTDFLSRGGKIRENFEVTRIDEARDNCDFPILIEGKVKGEQNSRVAHVQCRHLISCAGLHSDRLAQLSNCAKDPKIVPFRGDYLKLKPEACHLVKGNIYPVPDPRFPFLGVHFTPRIDGSVWLGPNAVLALKREGYGLFDFQFKDAWDALTYPGFHRVAWKYLSVGMAEMFRAINTNSQVKLLQRYIPELEKSDVERGPSGVRAQALDRSGKLVDDFVIHTGGDTGLSKHIMHVRNAPSPAATSSLTIARLLADKAQKQFNLSN